MPANEVASVYSSGKDGPDGMLDTDRKSSHQGTRVPTFRGDTIQSSNSIDPPGAC